MSFFNSGFLQIIEIHFFEEVLQKKYFQIKKKAKTGLKFLLNHHYS